MTEMNRVEKRGPDWGPALRGAAGVAVAVLALVTVNEIQDHGKIGDQGTKITSLENKVGDLQRQLAHNKTDIIDMAQAEVESHQRAEGLAAYMTQVLNKNQVASMNLLNGRIDLQSKDGTFQPEFEYPILLETVDPQAETDINGDFVHGAWLGRVNNDQAGNVVISVEAFDPHTERVTFYSQSELVRQNLGVYGSMEDVGSKSPAQRILFAYDLSGKSVIQDASGQPIHPGLSLSMK